MRSHSHLWLTIVLNKVLKFIVLQFRAPFNLHCGSSALQRDWNFKGNVLLCLTNQISQNIPPVSCCLHFLWSCLDLLLCVNTCTFSAYLLHHLITCHITDKKQMKNTIFGKRHFITKSHVTACLFFFFYKIHGQCTTHSQKQNTAFLHWSLPRPCTIHKDFTDNKWLDSECICFP